MPCFDDNKMSENIFWNQVCVKVLELLKVLWKYKSILSSNTWVFDESDENTWSVVFGSLEVFWKV